jgi:hypothetical protein
MATTYKIHPAIGIARVGNSPDEFFIGPERRGEEPNPVGGFKDAQCRVTRQAARFRIFAHHDAARAGHRLGRAGVRRPCVGGPGDRRRAARRHLQPAEL